MNNNLQNLAENMMLLTNRYLPRAYQLGKDKAERKYGIISAWGDRDNINIMLLLERYKSELAKSMAKAEVALTKGFSLTDIIKNFIARAGVWSWVLSPAMAMGLAAGIEQNRTEIGRAENLEPSDIGIIWYNAEDERVCDKCLYLTGRWFNAKDAYEICKTIHFGCRCSRFFDVGTPDEAIVGPMPGYRAGTAQDIYRDLSIEGSISKRFRRASQYATPTSKPAKPIRF